MFSKTTEITGFAAISVSIAFWANWQAGLLFAGLALLFVGYALDDVAIGLSLNRGLGWLRYFYHRQMLKERLAKQRHREPLIDTATSPHPQLIIDPETERWAREAAQARLRRERVNGRVPAPDEESELERLI
jgi:hypothetical protein